jgi:hypothetical protein
VFKSQPYDDDWDGASSVQNIMVNKELPISNYYYIIDKKGDGSEIESGYVELVK